jgi:hypothetical protein
MNTTKNHHAAIFTTPHQLHFLITTKCTYDAFWDATYKPYLTEGTVPLEMASFEIEWRDMNGRRIPVGEFTGEDGAILWHDEFSTVADATTAMLEKLQSMSEQIAGHISVLARAATATVPRSLKAEAPDHSATYDANEKSPLAYLDDSAEFVLQELNRLHRVLRKSFGARKKILWDDWSEHGVISFYWGDLNRKAREGVAAAARIYTGDAQLRVGVELSDLPSALEFLRSVNAQLEAIQSAAA